MKKICHLIPISLALAITSYCSVRQSSVHKAGDFNAADIFKEVFQPGVDEHRSLRLSPLSFVAYCENASNGLKQSKEIGDFVFSAFYQPPGYMALKECQPFDSLNERILSDKIEQYVGMTNFMFRIENSMNGSDLLKTDLDSPAEYYARLEYLSFKIQEEFKLIQGKDTMPCNMFHFERIYSLAPFATFVLGFPKVRQNEDIKLWYHDKLFKNGIIMLSFKTAEITDLPTIDI